MRRIPFDPIPGLWRFHVLYLAVTSVMGWAFFPYRTFVSLFLIAAGCAVGLLFSYIKLKMASHILALAIGLGTPVVVFAGMAWWHTGVLFIILLSAIFVFRHELF